MRTLCKKALAFCLVAALALTCFVGTFSVSAAEFGATITVAPVTVEQGETSVPVVLAVDSAAAGINEALIKVSSTVGTIDAEATLVKDAAGTAYTEDELELLDYSINYIQDATDYGSFYLSSKTTDSGVTAAFIKVVFTVAADKAAGDYAVAIDIPADKVIAASAAEDVIKFTYEEANITIVLPHVHNEVWTSDNAGNHTSSCNVEGCPGFTPATEACADGDDEDLLCDKCGYDLTPATPDCTHENAVANKVVKFEEGVINYYTECADCGELTLASTDSSDNAATHAATVANFATYSAIELTTVGTATIKLPDVEQAAIKLAYVKDDKIIGNAQHTNVVKYNPITLSSYADGVVTIDSTVTGVIIAYTLADSTALDSVLSVATMSTAIELQSNIAYKFKLPKARLLYNNETVFDSLYTVIAHDAYDVNTMETIYVTNTTPDSETEAANHIFVYPVAAKQMADNVTCNYYGVKDGVSYLIRVKANYSVVNYASTVAFAASNTDAELKTLVADMLNYGAEAQKLFNYHTDLYANEHPDVVDNMTCASATIAKENIVYAPSKSETNKVTISGAEKNIVGWSKSLSCEDKVVINYKLNLTNFKSYYADNVDAAINGLTFKITYYDAFGEKQEVPLTMNDVDYKEGVYEVFVCDYIVATKMATESTFEVYYNGDLISTTYYSINYYLQDSYDSTFKYSTSVNTLGDVCKALATDGATVESYFA